MTKDRFEKIKFAETYEIELTDGRKAKAYKHKDCTKMINANDCNTEYKIEEITIAKLLK